MASSKNIVVFGSINQDFFTYVERFPRPGESVRGNMFKISNGGKGANQAVAIALLGADVAMIGMVGNDIFANAVLKNLEESNVNTDLIQRMPTNTGCAVITVNEQGENNIIITPGANDNMSAKRAIELEKQIGSANLIICQSEIPEEANIQAFQIAKQHGVKTFLNPAPCNKNMNRHILQLTDILCVNETEAETILNKNLSGDGDFKQAARDLLEFGPSLAIITLGKRGALLAYHKDQEVQLDEVGAPKVEAVDTTGAGDCFAGAFACLFVNHPQLSYKEMVGKASQIAAISVKRHGCQPSYPYVERFPRQNETVFSNKFLMANGGKGASAAVMASLIGADVKLIGQTGDDIFADSCLKMLSKVGINTQHIVRNRNATTAIAIIQVDSKGENCLVTHLGANMEFMPDQIKQFETQIASAKILLCQNEIPHESNLTAFRLARKHNVTTFLNAAPYRDGITLEDELFKLTNILCTNETETEALIGRQLQCIGDFEKAARDLLKVGPKYVIVTLGENGCLVAEQLEDGSVKVNKFDAIKVEVVDTTGAGDCFCGAFAYFYVSGLGVNDCAKKAAQVASLSTTRPGNQSSYPTKEEAKEFMFIVKNNQLSTRATP
ncbi:Ribokinase-like protein [Aphelenchoides bicaudatus]|nr:Ribokinase-like protein [Aphelenchoides bicaudatus]